MAGFENQVMIVLRDPDEIRRSKLDAAVFLFYKALRSDRWVCAVCKRLNGNGFVITAYLTDSIKAGEKIWPK